MNDRRLKLSYWYITHKLLLRRLLIGFLIAISIGMYSYAIFGAVQELFVYDRQYRELLANLPNDPSDYEYIRQVRGPQPVEVVGLSTIPATDNRYDFVATVQNPNDNWTVLSMRIRLISNGQVVKEREAFVLPAEQKIIGFYGVSNVSPSSAQVIVDNYQWHRYNEYDASLDPRLNFTVSNVEYDPVVEAGFSGKLPVSVLRFTITNDTAYSYWNVGVTMSVQSGSQVLAANYIALEQFRSGESRDVEIFWYENLPSGQSIRITPEVNVFDEASYMPVE